MWGEMIVKSFDSMSTSPAQPVASFFCAQAFKALGPLARDGAAFLIEEWLENPPRAASRLDIHPKKKMKNIGKRSKNVALELTEHHLLPFALAEALCHLRLCLHPLF